MLSARFLVLVFVLLGCSSTRPAGEAAEADPAQRAGQTAGANSMALPRHRAILVSDSISDLQQVGGSLYWVAGPKIYRRGADGTTEVLFGDDSDRYIQSFGVATNGRWAFIEHQALVIDGKQRLELSNGASMTWCGDRLFVADPNLFEIVDGKRVERDKMQGRLSQRSCAAGRLAYIVQDGVRILNLESGTWTKPLPVTTTMFLQLAVSPDGKYVAGVEHMGTMHLWNADGVELAVWPAIAGQASKPSFSPDGRSLASGWAVVSVPDFKVLSTIDGKETAWLSNATLAASSLRGGVIHLVDLDGDRRLRKLSGWGAAGAMMLDPVRDEIVVTMGHRLSFWSADGLTFLREFHVGVLSGGQPSQLDDGSSLVGLREAIVHFSPDGKRQSILPIPGSETKLMSVDRQQDRVAVPVEDHVVVYDRKTWTPLFKTKSLGERTGSCGEACFQGDVTGVSLHPDGAVLAVASKVGTELVSIPEGKTLAALDKLPGYGSRVWFSPTGDRLLHVSSAGARLYDWPSMKSRSLDDEVHDAHRAVFSADSKTVVLSSWRGDITKLDLSGSTAQLVWQSRAPWHVGAHTVDFARGRVLTSGPGDELLVWSLAAGKLIKRIPAATGHRATALGFSPSGRYVASGTNRGDLFVFDLKERTQSSRRFVEALDSEIEQIRVGDNGEAWAIGQQGLLHLNENSAFTETNLAQYQGYGALSAPNGRAIHIDPSTRKFVSVDLMMNVVQRQALPADVWPAVPDDGFQSGGAILNATGDQLLDWRDAGSGSGPYQARRIDLKTKTVVAQIEVPTKRPSLVGWSRKTAFSYDTERGELHEWPAKATKPKIRKLPEFEPMAVSATHIAGLRQGTPVVLALDSLEIVQVLPAHWHEDLLPRIFSMAFDEDGTRLATGDSNGTIWVWNVATGKPEARLAAATGQFSLQFDDGQARQGAFGYQKP